MALLVWVCTIPTNISFRESFFLFGCATTTNLAFLAGSVTGSIHFICCRFPLPVTLSGIFSVLFATCFSGIAFSILFQLLAPLIFRKLNFKF